MSSKNMETIQLCLHCTPFKYHKRLQSDLFSTNSNFKKCPLFSDVILPAIFYCWPSGEQLKGTELSPEIKHHGLLTTQQMSFEFITCRNQIVSAPQDGIFNYFFSLKRPNFMSEFCFGEGKKFIYIYMKVDGFYCCPEEKLQCSPEFLLRKCRIQVLLG